MENNKDTLITMPVGRLLLKFSLPAIAGMIVVSSLVGIGASALISIKLGENNKDEAQGLLGNAITLLIGLMLSMTLLGLIFKVPILKAFGASDATMPYAVDYMTVLLYGAIFQGIGTGLVNVVRASGHPVKSMMIVIVGTLLNIILDPILIFTLDMGISGAAWATIIAQLVTAVMVIGDFLSEKSQIKIEKQKLKLHLITIKSILSIGFAAFAMQLSSVVVSIISNNALKTYGGDVAIGGIFTSEPELITKASSGMRLFLLMLPLISAQIVGASYFQAIGEAKKAAFLGLLRQVLLLIPLLLISPYFFGLNGVWGAGALSDLISSLIAIVALKSSFKHLNKLSANIISLHQSFAI